MQDIKIGNVTLYNDDCLNVMKKLHPTQKPLALIEELVKTYTNKGDLVLDSCMGSNTTGLACKNLERSYIGIERDIDVFKIAIDRVNDKQKRGDIKNV